MTELVRAFGGSADGCWFRGNSVILVPTGELLTHSMDVDPIALNSAVEEYRLQKWAYHDSSHCPFPELHQLYGHSVEYRCMWQGRAWVRDGDQATIELITNSLNSIQGLCRRGTA